MLLLLASSSCGLAAPPPRVEMRVALRLLVLACATAGAAVPPTVRLGYITPFSGAWSGGVQMEAAVVLALEDVNAATRILPSTTLERVVRNSKCDPGLGMKLFIGNVRS